ncbi:D-glycerate 3-kinase [Caulobacter ginsengisoli]|uniref:D-glycerate 3-kinase n=1 Tax=Caulobacter ginsengisoli TaxID=400775 RepID=A0ABU0IK47_9CAUL|nr:kinase [Caulobacter ginsengisoli]MDQ0462385.1 D-glycerate 3-kinase [Caulobacter ginsengisoli]
MDLPLLDPVLEAIATLPWRGRPPLVGIAGAQGSGKTTLARAVSERLGGVQFSLDDVYLTKTERADLAAHVHPLLAVRGPPGTHDLALLQSTVTSLNQGGRTALPAFDKLADDRTPGPMFEIRPGVIVIDGWCLGATAQDATALAAPINDLERDNDGDGRWRTWINDRLATGYAALFDSFDLIVHLAAPGFETVLDWRCEQEEGLLGGPLPPGRRAELARFIQHFERITRHMLAGGCRADLTFHLDEARRPI